MIRFRLKYQKKGNKATTTTTITAVSMTQAKEKLKERYNGNVTIISCVKL